jgi:hypothetical protein
MFGDSQKSLRSIETSRSMSRSGGRGSCEPSLCPPQNDSFRWGRDSTIASSFPRLTVLPYQFASAARREPHPPESGIER